MSSDCEHYQNTKYIRYKFVNILILFENKTQNTRIQTNFRSIRKQKHTKTKSIKTKVRI